MKKHLTMQSKLGDDRSDALSTATNNSGHHSGGEASPSMLQNPNGEETDSIYGGSKKIRKKRNAYQKIEDDVRLKLLDAVQKHGETLKSAAKKYKINYSSAKSILHTYRKEGRILKKSAQERNIKRNSSPGREMDASPTHHSDDENMEPENEPQIPQKSLQTQENTRIDNIKDLSEDLKTKSMSPINGLMDNFVNLLKLGQMNNTQGEGNGKLAIPTPKAPGKLNPSSSFSEVNPAILNAASKGLADKMAENPAIPANLAQLSNLLGGNSMDKLKMLDTLCSKFTNSPLIPSTVSAKENTDPSAKQKDTPHPKELESFTEMVTALQNQPRQTEEIFMPHPLRFNTAQLLQDKIETKLNNETAGNDDEDWNGAIENAAMDTFKSFLDAQLLLCDALKKASYLNSLMQLQKSKTEVSPTNRQIQGFKNA